MLSPMDSAESLNTTHFACTIVLDIDKSFDDVTMNHLADRIVANISSDNANIRKEDNVISNKNHVILY